MTLNGISHKTAVLRTNYLKFVETRLSRFTLSSTKL